MKEARQKGDILLFLAHEIPRIGREARRQDVDWWLPSTEEMGKWGKEFDFGMVERWCNEVV